MEDFQVLDHITDGVMSLDSNWKFRNLNRTAARLLKRRPADLLGREIWAEYPDLIGSSYEAAYRQAAETGMPSTATDFYPPLGAWFEVRAFPCDDGVIVLVRDVTEARAISERLSRQATHDELTGLINRRELLLRLNRLVDEGAAASVDLLFIDLDRFKDINDSFGHAAGDEVLRAIGERLSDMLAERAHVSRIGGDEFVIFLVDAPEGEAARVARDVLVRMREPIQTPCVRASVGASIGLARYPISASSAHELLRNADTAMYHAKRAGGSHVWSFGKEDAQRLSHRLRLRADLEGASAARQFELHYQPQLDLHTGRVYGAEALIRWNHPQLGLLTPADFLDMLLESPAYEATGEWLIRLAFRQAAQWQSTDRIPFKVAVNLSATTIQNCDLAALVSEAAEASGVCASILDIEVTESAVMSDFAAASRALSAVRRLGVTVSLDDFGTGYSSLAYLIRLPVDRIKIDKSFVQKLTVKETCHQARAMVEAMVALARALGMGTVAEGIETETQLVLAKELGCDAAQGYFIGKPVPAARIEPYAETRFEPAPTAILSSQNARSGHR
ncbi:MULTISPECIES: EAL domain-containing protein [unclassified Caballeronia]|uniref:putative bifunctional diguanylate cyclase/phosphodiesterase n=1 Tax=unclassified Caballeronia TaxID=2646786 RepID=UPI002867028A|nr:MULTISPECIES: EAL domain-containing protein [unclassified Caballeronia]MDR5752226.1 EAL domain-containing protein [Caballeronia sp. LZ024]MDR5841743.1 EAL domain-containing protein [Caballeronia sp. LZ031]